MSNRILLVEDEEPLLLLLPVRHLPAARMLSDQSGVDRIELPWYSSFQRRLEGRSLVYEDSFSTMTGLIDYLTRHCCAGDPAACGIAPR